MIEFAVATLTRGGHDLGDGRGECENEAGLARSCADDAHVLVVQIDPEARLERPSEHVWSLLIEHFGTSKTASDDLQGGFGVNAVRFEEDHGFCESLNIRTDYELVRCLDGLP